MYKAIAALIIFISIGGYYFSPKNSDNSGEELLEEEVSSVETQRKNLLKEEKLHEAFEKILEKKNQDDRLPASKEIATEESSNNEIIDNDDDAHMPEFDYEAEFDGLSIPEREKAIQNLRFEIAQDERLLEQMDQDQKSGLNITEAEVSSIAQRTENKKNRLEFFISRMNRP